mmetsp:Transcript_8512/g.16387  ORF Transcript_8512/g.16387 Transcript_8512/m.16387 type:complete len:412 (+) Transcript_8512:29-1264(+)
MAHAPFLICDDCCTPVHEPQLRKWFQPFPVSKLYHGYYRLCSFKCARCKGGPVLHPVGKKSTIPTFKQVSQIAFLDLTLRTSKTWHRIRDIAHIIEQDWTIFFGSKPKGQTPSHTVSASITTSAGWFQRHSHESGFWALRNMGQHFREYLPAWQDEFRCHELEIAHQTDPAKVGGKLDGTWNPPAWDLSQARAASAQLTVPTTADKRVRQAPEKNLREADGGTDSPESTWLYCLAHFATVGNVTKHEEDVALPKRGARQADIPAQQEQPHKRARLHVQRATTQDTVPSPPTSISERTPSETPLIPKDDSRLTDGDLSDCSSHLDTRPSPSSAESSVPSLVSSPTPSTPSNAGSEEAASLTPHTPRSLDTQQELLHMLHVAGVQLTAEQHLQLDAYFRQQEHAAGTPCVMSS